jgi:hypothetical protein
MIRAAGFIWMVPRSPALGSGEPLPGLRLGSDRLDFGRLTSGF